MIIVKCDRCGKEKVVKNIFPVFGENNPVCMPKYSITTHDEDGLQTISLCSGCETAFDGWLKSYAMDEEEHTIEEFMHGQDMGSTEDGSL